MVWFMMKSSCLKKSMSNGLFLCLMTTKHYLIVAFHLSTYLHVLYLRIEMQIFSLHWMMQNIRLFNVCEARRFSLRH